MICPRCQTSLSDDVVICDNCNFIIDPAFLGDQITNRAAEKPATASQETRVRQVEVAPQAPAPAARTAPREATPGPGAMAGRKEEERQPRISLEKMAAPPASVVEAMDDLVSRFKAFSLSERITAACALIIVGSLGLPWRWSQSDEEVIGLFANGWPIGLVAIFVVGAAYLRRSPSIRPYSREVLLATAVLSLISLLAMMFYVHVTSDHIVVYMAGMAPRDEMRVKPEFGVWLALGAGLVMTLSSFAGVLNPPPAD